MFLGKRFLFCLRDDRNGSINVGMVMTCPYCEKEPELVDSIEVYKTRSYGLIYICRPCQAWVGVHKGSTVPLGRLADKSLRKAKMLAHRYFDPIWKKGHMNRHDAYTWLSKQLGIDRDQTHIGMFDVETCMRVVTICQENFK